jgi:hypothetical protein
MSVSVSSLEEFKLPKDYSKAISPAYLLLLQQQNLQQILFKKENI